jgi:sugar phosphate isomerase/epimerase
VRERLLPGGEFGIGLRLSARAAAELAEPAELAAFKDFLARSRMYVFTINGFPYGSFHGTRVKEEVYLPDWRDPERLRYTDQLADLLAELLPDDAAMEGSVSTVPGAYKPALGGAQDVAIMVEHLLRHVAHLVALRARTGRLIALALEPEPCCFLETIAEAVAFFGSELHGTAAVRRTMALTGLDATAAARALHDHLGLCLDLCHAAVEFEDPAEVLQRLEAAGIRVCKMQISAGLRLPTLDVGALAALRRFDDRVYLHQVVQRGPDGLVRYTDLPAAFDALQGATAGKEWRVHFHVPIFMDRLEPFGSTQSFIREVLAIQRARSVSAHLEVETYTWGMLPEPFCRGTVDEAVARELAWARKELAA